MCLPALALAVAAAAAVCVRAVMIIGLIGRGPSDVTVMRPEALSVRGTVTVFTDVGRRQTLTRGH